MADLKSLDNLYLILGFFAPGLITLSVRAQFITGRRPTHSAALLSYLIVSIIYYALTFPLLVAAFSISEPGYARAFAWFGLVFIGPCVLGVALGLNVQRGWLGRISGALGVYPVHPIPTAWDWRFGKRERLWVLITLKDGTRFAGFCGSDSFMSSDPAERDIYVERLYDLDEDDNWTDRGENSLLVAAGEIRTIEMWPDRPAAPALTQETRDGE